MNKIYESLRLFTNFFLPVIQLTRKTRQGAKVTRSYDVPCTPYERVLTSPCIMEQAKEALRHQYQKLDPVALHDTILEDQRCLQDLVLARKKDQPHICLLYTSDAADDLLCVDLGGRRIIKKKKKKITKNKNKNNIYKQIYKTLHKKI